MIAMLMFMFATLQDSTPAEGSQPPRLRNPKAIVVLGDYPAEALRRGEYGLVSFVVRVSAEGKILSCDVSETSGHAILDAKTCALVKSRARFDPARDASGSAVAGEYRMVSTWGVGEHQPRAAMNLPLQVSRMPAEYRSPVKTRLVFDASGHATSCEIVATSGSAAADRAACGYIRQQFVISPPKSASRDVPAAAVRYVTTSLSIQPVDAAEKK